CVMGEFWLAGKRKRKDLIARCYCGSRQHQPHCFKQLSGRIISVIRDPWHLSTSRRNITPSSFDSQFALRFLSSGIDVELQFTSRAVPILVRGDKRQVVAAAQVIDQRLKGRV